MDPAVAKIFLKLYISACLFILVQLIMGLITSRTDIELLNRRYLALSNPGLKNTNVLGTQVKKPTDGAQVVFQTADNAPLPFSEFTLTVTARNLPPLKVYVGDSNWPGLFLATGSPLPGERGNVRIDTSGDLSGLDRSVSQIKPGDEIIVDIGGQRLQYMVQSVSGNTKKLLPVNYTFNDRYLTIEKVGIIAKMQTLN